VLQVHRLAYQPGPLSDPLFEDLSLSLDRGETVCLTGPNGAGKTALIELIAGLRRPQRGEVVFESSARPAYVPQDVERRVDGTLSGLLLGDRNHGEELASFKRALARLGIPPERCDDPASVFSVGERIRAAIARAVIDVPDVLLLDEPTNHLDIEGKTWVIRFLESWKGACLMVCHDRAVIDAVASRTLILERGSLQEYSGGYTDARAAKELSEERARGQYEREQKEQRRLKIAAERTLQKAASVSKKPTGRTYDPKAKAFYAGLEAKLDRRAAAIKKRVSQVEARTVEKPFEPDAVKLAFAARPLRSGIALSVRGLFHDFGGRELYRGLSIDVERGCRLALVGPNGSGKSTLFRIILGEIVPNSGSVTLASDAVPAYLTQGRERLDPELILREAIGGDPDSVRVRLGCLGIRYQASDKRVGMLSVGERTKAELVALLGSPANLLLLDEPTNHLDVPALEALEEALLEFPGAIVFASHDEAFIERVATEVLHLGR